MNGEQWRDLLIQYRVIGVIRSPELKIGIEMAKAIAKGGIRLIEITWNSVEPVALLAHLQGCLSDCYIGVGTILTPEDLKTAIAHHCQFCFSPHSDPQLIDLAIHANIPMIPGALTPTEIITAWQNGASSVKVFPIQAVGGVNYIQSLEVPLKGIPLIPTGGVTLDNAASFLSAGAIAVGLSGQLFPKEAIKQQNWSLITDNALKICSSLQN